MSPLLLVGLAGAALLALTTQSDAAPGGAVPASVLERITNALASGNPSAIRYEAARLRAEGYRTHAADLERAALQLEAMGQPGGASSLMLPASSTLRRGSVGPEVSSWQTFLVSQGYTSIEVDGNFGVQTEDATKAFQSKRGQKADGIVGPETLRAAQSSAPAAPPPPPEAPKALGVVTVGAPMSVGTLRRGSTGSDVSSWQTFLRSQGFTAITVDGNFGVQTEDATKSWQSKNGQKADGIVGPETLRAAAKAPPVAPPAPAPAAPPVTAKRTLSHGLSGEDVLAWQQFLLREKLIKAQYVDGKYGSVTTKATAAFQTSRGLPADGVVGPATLAAASKPAPVAPPKPSAPAPLPPPPPAVAAPAATRLLKRGVVGPDVLAWQTFLRTQGYTAVAADGNFGVQTEDATKAFQGKRGQKPDGVVGPETLSAAAAAPPVTTSAPTVAAPKPAPVAAAPAPAASATVTPSKWRTLRRGSSGADVKEWQTVLSRDGYPVTIDGIFGPDVETKTKKWQAARKLVADGIVGAGTVKALRAKPPATVRVAGDFMADTPLPGIIAPAAPPDDDVSPDRSLAARLALHLYRTVPGAEDRDLVSEFQRLRGLNPTGAYGPGTAKALGLYGLVPPKPFYWPSQSSQREKANYRDWLKREAAKDPQRAPEWTAAASRI